MPNPILTPPLWAPGVIWTVSQSNYLALDITLAEIDDDAVVVILTLPAGAEARLVRDPANWAASGTPVLTAGAWSPGPVILGNWSAQVVAGAAATDPATLSISNNDGLAPSGLLRIILTGLGGAAAEIEPSSGNLSIDRVLADPALHNVQVSSGLPVRERANVTLSASPLATVAENGAAGLPALPALLSEWIENPANAIAVSSWVPSGASASFTAPGIYNATQLNFTFTAAYDLAANGLRDAGDPSNAQTLPVSVEEVNYGLVFVMDRSGSMGSVVGGKSQWAVATEAAHACCDLFRAFRSGDNHLAGVVTFEHRGCSWTPTPAGDITLRDPVTAGAATELAPLADFGNANDWDLGDPQDCTPIGDGLIAAWRRIGIDLGPNDRGAVVLLTDGYENAGSVTIAATAGPASQTFTAARVAPGAVGTGNTLIGNRVYTMAIGQSVDEDRLDDLGTAIYHRTDVLNEIRGAFAQMLGDVIDAQEEMAVAVGNDPAPPAHPLYYRTGSDEQVIAFLVFWAAASDKLRIGWRAQGSTGDFTLLNPADPAVTFTQRGRHGLMRVNLTAAPFSTQPGIEWRVEHLDTTESARPLTAENALVMVDLSTKIEVSFDRRSYFIGDPIGLTARIRKGGAPVTGATVGVDVAQPGEGLGTFLGTNAARYKEVRPDGKAKGDAAVGKGAMFQTLLRSLQITGLPVVTPPDFTLLDDGTYGDGRANVGLYGGAFTDTAREGTYSFRWRISATLPDGSQVSRVFVRSTWVGVRPDPTLLGAVWTTVADGIMLVTFTPKAANGELLGPWRTAVISMSVVDGSFDGPLIDNLDGSYSRRVKAVAGSDPLVSISVYGAPMDPTSPVRAGGGAGVGERCLCLWWRALVCTWQRFIALVRGK